MSHTICINISIHGFIVRLKPVQNKMNCNQTGRSGYANKLLIVEIYKIYNQCNPFIADILSALFPLRLSIFILNFPCAEGARDVNNIRVTVIISLYYEDFRLYYGPFYYGQES